MKKLFAIVMVCILCIGLAACGSTYEGKYGSDTSSGGSVIDSESAAISAVQGDSRTASVIADHCGFKFHYAPEYGTCEAKEGYNGGWTVTVRGNMSGYRDDYKQDFDNKSFYLVFDVSESGYVSEH